MNDEEWDELLLLIENLMDVANSKNLGEFEYSMERIRDYLRKHGGGGLSRHG